MVLSPSEKCSLCACLEDWLTKTYNEFFSSDFSRIQTPRPLQAYHERANEGCRGCTIVTWIVKDYCSRFLRPHYDKVKAAIWIAASEFEQTSPNIGCVVPVDEHDPPKPDFLDLETEDVDSTTAFSGPAGPSGPLSAGLTPFGLNYGEVLSAHLELFKYPGSVDRDSSALLRDHYCFPLWECTNTADAKFIHQIKFWLNRCKREHNGCSSQEGTLLPTRVIDISRLKINGEPCLHLSRKAEIGRYMCLSHCWGGTQPVQTTRSSIAAHQKAIKLADLPQTFKDIVRVALQLEIDYLWIDSLCIVQDDVEDWTREAGRMADIYANSLLTISATASGSCHGGLFQQLPGDDSPFGFRQVPSDMTRGLQTRLWYRYRVEHDSVHDLQADQTPFQQALGMKAPLLERAWCFQENLLSPRIVHFGSWEITWDCAGDLDCCCTPNGLLNAHPGLSHLRLHRTLTSRQPISEWPKIVEAYSAKRLTKPTDRLTALSGIARQLQVAMEEIYLAGLWRGDLINGLLWLKRWPWKSEMPAPLNQPYLAPSWSWACLNAPVKHYWRDLDEKGAMSILDAHCEANELDSTGAVTDGFIRVSGRVAPCTIKSVTERLDTLEITGTSVLLNVDMDRPIDEAAVATMTLYCLFIAKMKAESMSKPCFLVLERCHADRYRRVGLAWGNKSDWLAMMDVSTTEEITII